jgi:hypothetical protein
LTAPFIPRMINYLLPKGVLLDYLPQDDRR